MCRSRRRRGNCAALERGLGLPHSTNTTVLHVFASGIGQIGEIMQIMIKWRAANSRLCGHLRAPKIQERKW